MSVHATDEGTPLVLITVLIIALIILVLIIVLIMMKIMASGMMVMRREDSDTAVPPSNIGPSWAIPPHLVVTSEIIIIIMVIVLNMLCAYNHNLLCKVEGSDSRF